MNDSRVGAYFTALAAVATVLVLLRYASVGIDLSDESLYLYDIARGRASAEDFTQFHVIIGWFTDATPSVRGLRVAGLILDIFTAAALGLTTRWFLARRHVLPAVPHPFLFAAVPASAQLLAHNWLPATPSYNGLGAWLISAALCVLLLSLEWPSRWYLGIGLGGLLWLHLFVKWPSAVVMVTLCGAVLATGRRWRALYTMVGAFVGLGFVSFRTVIFGLDLASLRRSTELLGDTESHGISPLLRDHVRSTLETGDELVSTPYGLLAVGVVLVVVAVAGHQLWCFAACGALLALAAVVGDFGELLTGDPQSRRLAFAGLVLVMAGGVLYWAARSPNRAIAAVSQHREVAIVMGAFAVAPFAAALGTDNDLWRQMQTAAAPIGVLAVCAVGFIRGSSAALVPLVVVFSMQTAFGSVVTPYRQIDLRQHGVHQEAFGVAIDEERAETLAVVESLGRTYLRDGDRVFVAFKQPGLALVLNAPIAGPTWTGGQVDAVERLCPAIERNRRQFDEVAMVVLTEELGEEASRCVSRAWPAFTAYQVVAELDAVVPGSEFVKVLVPAP